MTKQEFLAADKKAQEKAKKTGKFTRLGAGQYYLFAQGVLYYLRKREFAAMHGWGHEWTWQVDGQYADDSFSTLSEAKQALLNHIKVSAAN